PGKQTKPAAWTNLTFAALKQELRLYNSNCLAAFKAAGAMPDYVQVGNEITSGLLWPEGRVGGVYDTATQWSQLAQLLTNAIAGIQDAAGGQMPQVMVHIDRGGDWGGTQWFFDHLQQQRVPFDLIGLSYYPWWHGSLDALGTCLTNTAQHYGKPVLLAETGFPWANSTNLYGIPATPNGQVEYVVALAKVMKRLPGGRGAGMLWWGAEYQSLPGVSLAGFDKRSFFDAEGNVLPVAEAFGQLVAPLKFDIRLQGTNVLLQWPLSGAGSSLLTASEPTAAAWSPVTNTIATTGTVFGITAPSSVEPRRFFRLQAK
ncbi:MAG TPA: glycosyl hydrolase 53 family protein, partial [Candidatus Sulfotelmatobacter sp.]|nr:glycosyl hydrolase 53 family protein [Candidatus Sulfotelmatobacter sp.]